MSNSSPLSIILCNRNYAHFLRFALQGMTTQTTPPLELILIDDASTDESVSIMQEFASHHPWICIQQNTKQMGAYQAAQKGLFLAKGDWVYFAAADDRIFPSFVETMTSALTTYPEVGLICAKGTFFRKEHKLPLSLYEPPYTPTTQKIAAEHVISWKKKHGGIFGHTSVYQKKALIDIGGVREEIGSHCDWFFSHVLAFRLGMGFVPKILSASRVHGNNLSLQEFQKYKGYQNLLSLIHESSFADVQKKFYQYCVLKEKRKGLLKVWQTYPEYRPQQRLLYIRLYILSLVDMGKKGIKNFWLKVSSLRPFK